MKQSKGSWKAMMEMLEKEEIEFMREHEDMGEDAWDAWLEHIEKKYGEETLEAYLF